MITPPLSRHIGKAEAVIELSARVGIRDINGWDQHHAHSNLARIHALLPPICNEQIMVSAVEQLGLTWVPMHNAAARDLEPATFTNGRPACFGTGGVITAFSPDFKVLPIKNGYVGHFFGGALVVTSDGRSIVGDVSSRYRELYQYYDFDLAAILKDAPFIDGVVVPIADDIRPLNFCHWLVDWLPRLGFLGAHAYKSSVYVVTTPLIAQFQRDTLRMCGIDESRVIALEDFQAVRARELLVPSDLRQMPHPIHQGAPWALSFLRSTVGFGSIMEVGHDVRRREKLYISRADATRRRVVNDQELSSALARFGYRTIQLSGLTIAEQAARFAYASHVISIHGAGLSNLVFCAPGTQVIEIFPASYGILSFAVIAASMECPYATYLADNPDARNAAQFDDAMIDVPRFLAACDGLL